MCNNSGPNQRQSPILKRGRSMFYSTLSHFSLSVLCARTTPERDSSPRQVGLVLHGMLPISTSSLHRKGLLYPHLYSIKLQPIAGPIAIYQHPFSLLGRTIPQWIAVHPRLSQGLMHYRIPKLKRPSCSVLRTMLPLRYYHSANIIEWSPITLPTSSAGRVVQERLGLLPHRRHGERDG